MLTEVDIERLPSFVIGHERGEAKGEAVGEARGQELATQQIVKRLLTRMEAAQVAELLDLPSSRPLNALPELQVARRTVSIVELILAGRSVQGTRLP